MCPVLSKKFVEKAEAALIAAVEKFNKPSLGIEKNPLRY
jgi:hypothetical protein